MLLARHGLPALLVAFVVGLIAIAAVIAALLTVADQSGTVGYTARFEQAMLLLAGSPPEPERGEHFTPVVRVVVATGALASVVLPALFLGRGADAEHADRGLVVVQPRDRPGAGSVSGHHDGRRRSARVAGLGSLRREGLISATSGRRL